jgi:hypothetical protein
MKRHLNPLSVVAIIICVYFASIATLYIPFTIIRAVLG